MAKVPDGVRVQLAILDAVQDGQSHEMGCANTGGWTTKLGSSSEYLIAEQVWHLIATGCLVVDPESVNIRPFVDEISARGKLPAAAPDRFITLLRNGATRVRITGPGSDRLFALRQAVEKE